MTKNDEIKAKYSKLSFSTASAINEKELLLKMWREQAKLYGIDPMKVRIEKQRELGKELSVDEEKQIIQQEIMKKTQKNSEHRLVGENELLTYLNQGWELIQPVNGKFLVRK